MEDRVLRLVPHPGCSACRRLVPWVFNILIRRLFLPPSRAIMPILKPLLALTDVLMARTCSTAGVAYLTGSLLVVAGGVLDTCLHRCGWIRRRDLGPAHLTFFLS